MIQRAMDAGIYRILVPGIDIETSKKAIHLAERYHLVFAAVGVHPNESHGWNRQSCIELRQLAQHPKAVAIGEIGLDFYRDRVSKEIQIYALKMQLDLAGSNRLPLILHNRNAFEELWACLDLWVSEDGGGQTKAGSSPGVFHSFQGSADECDRLLQGGFFVGISGPITYPNAIALYQMTRRIPLEKILLETDAPYLPPQEFRGHRNEPAFIRSTADKMAEQRNIDPGQLYQATALNANQLFNWGLTD